MFTSYFLPRWETFFSRLNASLDSGIAFDRKPAAAELCQWEQGWSHSHALFASTPTGDGVAIAKRLVAKWRGGS